MTKAPSPRRVYQPRPSGAARKRILAVARALVTDPAAPGLLAGYAVSAGHLIELLSPHFTEATVRNYLTSLARDGALCRGRFGHYVPPVVRA